MRRALRSIRRTIAWGPFETWARVAVREFESLHARRRVDVVWAIHGDDSSHEIAFRFHRATGVPWVADFKDPWNLFHPPRAWALQWLMTRRRVRTAASITETSHAQAARDRRFGRSIEVIWSGYDADLMRDATPQRVRRGFTLLYTGRIAAKQHDEDAIARFLQRWRESSASPGDVELHFYATDPEFVGRALERRGVRDMVHFHPLVERREAFGLMKGADALVMLPATNWSPSGGSVGLKELEYFASGTPVLCLGRLLDEMRSAAGPQVMEALDADSGARFIREEHRVFISGLPSPRRVPVNSPIVVRHSWQACARVLSRVLQSAAERRAIT